jgi:hypothetical protein
MMTSDDFYDFAKESDKFLNTAPIKISNLSWIRISRDDFPMIKLGKHSIHLNLGNYTIYSKKDTHLSQSKRSRP